MPLRTNRPFGATPGAGTFQRRPSRPWACSSTRSAGIVNLGAEGMMLCAAIAGFATVVHTGNTWLACCQAWRPVPCWPPSWRACDLVNTNQYATGLALSVVRRGLLGVCGHQLRGRKLPGAQVRDSVLGDVPLLARRCSVSIRWWPPPHGAGGGLIWFLYRSRAGLVLRSVGRSRRVGACWATRWRIRLAAVVVGGAQCGSGRGFISHRLHLLWSAGMVAGAAGLRWHSPPCHLAPGTNCLPIYLFGGM